MHWVGHILSRVARSIINMLLTLKSATPAVRSAARIYRCFSHLSPVQFPGHPSIILPVKGDVLPRARASQSWNLPQNLLVDRVRLKLGSQSLVRCGVGWI